MKRTRDSTITSTLRILMLVLAPLGGCSTEPLPSAPTAIASPPIPPPIGPADPISEELYGSWEGPMSARSLTAQAKLTIGTELKTLSFRFVEGPPVPDWFNIDTSFVTVTSGENLNAVSFTFLSPNTRGDQGPYCWQGTFEGALRSVDACTRELTGTYWMQGWSEDCFQPPLSGTFSFRNSRCN